MQTPLAIILASSPLCSPPTPNSLSLLHLHIQGGHLCQLPYLFLSLQILFLMEGMISTVFLGSSESHTMQFEL